MKNLNDNYLFIPSQIRYSKSLTPNAKLLFGEIANRANEQGKAIFGYDELAAEIFNCDKTTVYLWIKALEEEGVLLSKMLRIKKVHFHAFLILIKPSDMEPGETSTAEEGKDLHTGAE